MTFFSMLAILFIGLKLAKVITWSWLWVTVPLWGGLAVVAFAFLIAGIVAVIVALSE